MKAVSVLPATDCVASYGKKCLANRETSENKWYVEA